MTPNDVFITYRELPTHGVPKYSRKHLLDMMRRGQFPSAVQVSPNRVAWRLSDLECWKANLPAARSVQQARDAA
jgi:predicted DNA-binding transcriptional regulator AlpA